jgi:hypothetical protein
LPILLNLDVDFGPTRGQPIAGFPRPEGESAKGIAMDSLTLFGLLAVTAMLLCYALEDRSRWFVLGFAASCALGSVYGFLQGAWPFGVVEAIWSFVALRRWVARGSPRPAL